MHRTRSWVVATVLLTLVALFTVPAPTQAAVIQPTPTNAAACHIKPALTPGTPVVTSLSRAPGSVDVRQHSKKVTFTLKATDATQDLWFFSIYVSGPNDDGEHEVRLTHRTQGTARDGTWVGAWTVPPGTHPGAWHIWEIIAEDRGFGQSAYVYPTVDNALPWGKGWPKTLKVTSKWDHAAPTIVSAVVKPAAVDTTAKAKSVLVTVKLSDPLSGVDGDITMYADDASQRHEVSTVLKLKSGTAKNGTYVGRLRIPTWAGGGTHRWALEYLFQDKLENQDDVTQGSISVTSRTDSSKPVIRSVSLSSVAVDARNGSQHVSVSMRVTDTHSGVDAAIAVLTPPEGDEFEVWLTRKSGTAFNGTWQGRFFVPRCNSAGDWKLEVVAADVGTNYSGLTSAKLKAKHLPYKVSVQALDAEAPFASVPDEVPHAGSLALTFTEPIYWKDGTINTTFLGLPAGTWTCKSPAKVVVTCDGASLVQTASFKPTADFIVGHTYSISSFDNIYDQYYNGPMSFDAEFTAT